MTNRKPINRISKHVGNGKVTTESTASEDHVGKIALVEPPVGTFGAGEYIIVDQTAQALFGVKLGSAFDGSEVKQIPLSGDRAWSIVRIEPDTYGLIESTILLLSEFAATPPEDRHEDLEDCIYEGAEYAAGALLRMLERRQIDRSQALVRELERIEHEATARFNGKQVAEISADDSGSDNTKLTAGAVADNDPIPVLLIDLTSFEMALAWIV
jgi:hypothetical protein